eukprot:4816396-Pyramimonas_sp.AAC.1
MGAALGKFANLVSSQGQEFSATLASEIAYLHVLIDLPAASLDQSTHKHLADARALVNHSADSQKHLPTFLAKFPKYGTPLLALADER